MKKHRRHSFILLEAMVAVAIFSVAVLGLGKCMDNLLRAQQLVQDEERARRALENRMEEIEAGAVKVTNPKTEELKPPFAGITLRQSREMLKWKNEKKEEIPNLFRVSLLVQWEARGDRHERSLDFYVQSAQP